ncbi:hypothetical protein ACFP3I_11280 [Chryseobacterium arachidis]|uniref:hypothetical protein n=1 Tax=Chryseobacterium arachidis TaxID=1416778 RepID=UPI003609A9B5
MECCLCYYFLRIENQLGAHIWKIRINKKGNSRIPKTLSMTAFFAVRNDLPQFGNLRSRYMNYQH